MEKKKVEIYDYYSDEVLDRLLLSEEQIKLLEYIKKNKVFNCDFYYRVFDDNVIFNEV